MMRKIQSWIQNNTFAFGLIVLLIPYGVWFILGQNSFVEIHDNLDSDFVAAKLLLESNHLWGFGLNGAIDQIMNGIPRRFFRSGFNFTFLLLYLFKPFTAYVLNHLIVHLIGYAGAYILLNRYFIKSNKWIVLYGALCFGFLSYFHFQFGISVSGQPLLLFSFLNILNKRQKFTDWLVILLFPFYSFLVMTLPFFLPILFVIFIYNVYVNKKINGLFVVAVLSMTLINLAVEFNLFFSIFGEGNIVSHRSIWDKYLDGAPNVSDFLQTLFKNLLHTQYHAGKLWPIPIILLSLFAMFVVKPRWDKIEKQLFYIIGFILLWVSLNNHMVFLLQDRFEILKVFQTDRFHFILPLLWIVLFCLILQKFNLKDKIQRNVLVTFSGIFVSGIIFTNTELITNINFLVGNRNVPTYGQFFDEKIFEDIDNYIACDKRDYRTMSIGMHPSIAQFNGFYTLDSYQNNYDLSYKYKFEKIIENELNKDDKLKAYFSNWGNRCYAFSADIGRNYLFDKHSYAEIISLDYNYEQAKKLGAKYIFSAVPIKKYDSNFLIYHKYFTCKKSYWKIYLYEIL